MKRRTLWVIVLTLILLISGSAVGFSESLNQERQDEINDDFKGLWVATVLNLDYPSKATSDSSTLKKEALQIINDAQAMGFNAIILQVRPSADAFYKSDIYPWSKYLTGKQGLAPKDNFDPLAFWIEEAHKRGIAVHAWINPYRITRKLATDPAHDLTQLASNHPAKLNPSWVVAHTDGNFYFNPGIPEVREHIALSIKEIIQNYDVDGIHFDDYFYPSTTFDDDAAFKKYGVSFKNLADWRRNNVDQLVEQVYKTIKATDEQVQFGISPFGIWANSKSISTGSKTSGFESYISQYADTKKWVENNMIDYIAPQIYWHIGYEIADYNELLKWWSNVAAKSDTKLYIGHAAYRVGNSDVNSPWYGVNEIYKQLRLNKMYPQVKGSIFFRYKFFKENSDLRALITNEYTDMIVQEEFVVGRPTQDVSTTANQYFLGGASDIRYPLFINGEEITSRTTQGYFGVYVVLKDGTNTYVFEQNGKKITRKITKVKPTLAAPMSKIEIIANSSWPQSKRMVSQLDEVVFSCRAPISANVSVKIGGVSYTLQPYTKTSSSKSPYATTYSLKTKLPAQNGNARIVDLGKPVYTMTYGGKTYTQTAAGTLQIAMEGAPFIATVVNDFVDTYETATTSDGAHYILHKGMKDYITGISGDFTRLASGVWIKSENITTASTHLQANVINRVSYARSKDKDEILFYNANNVVSHVSYDGSSLIVTVNHTSNAASITLPSVSVVSSAQLRMEKNKAIYTLKLSNPNQLGGYYLEDFKGGVKLVIKPKFKAFSQSDTLPLKGAVIMLDPGHGGKDSGAIGLLGALKPEKNVVLEIANKLKLELESKGAKVIFTRSTDVYMSLQERLSASKEQLPDLFLSIHADSLENTSDLTKISGFSVFYKDPLSKPLAQGIKEDVISRLLRVDRGAKKMNFYVVRGTWTPSILVETGFMPNPSEFQFLNTPSEQVRMAQSLTDSILSYFNK